MRPDAIAAAALIIALALIFSIWDYFGPVAYQGTDGKLYQTLAANALRIAPLFEVNILNPLQGMLSQQLPTNVWLNPVYAIFHVVGVPDGLNISTAIAYAAIAIATYVLGRVCGFAPAIATMAGIATIAAFPPFLFDFGLATQYMLIPATAFTMASWTLVLALVIRPPGGVLLSGAVYAVFILYILYVDPTFFATGLIGQLPFFALFGLTGGRNLIRVRLLALLLAAVVLYVVGAVDYAIAFVRYTARDHLLLEAPRPALPAYAGVLFSYPISAGLFYAILGFGWLAGAYLARGLTRLLCIACVVDAVVLFAAAAVYLLGGFSWPVPAPFYSEIAVYHLFILGGLGGWALAIAKMVQLLSPRLAGRREVVLAGGLICAVLPLAALGLYRLEPLPPVPNLYHEPWPEQGPEVAKLKDSTSLAANPIFRGSVAIMPVSYVGQWMATDLWRSVVPTLNEYGQMVTPLYHYVGTRIFAVPDKVYLNGMFLEYPRVPALSVMGVRFVLTQPGRTDIDKAGQGVRHSDSFSNWLGLPLHWQIYELPHPNVGDYSPTNVLRADAASLQLLKSDSIDFRRDVILPYGSDVPVLVPAQSARLSLDGTRIKISARSEGASLLVLPIQYSRCLEVQGTGSVRLVRADVLLTGVIFERSAEVELAFKFGLFNSTCRKSDLADLKRMNLTPQPLSASVRKSAFPFAVDSAEQIPSALAELADSVREAAANDPAYLAKAVIRGAMRPAAIVLFLIVGIVIGIAALASDRIPSAVVRRARARLSQFAQHHWSAAGPAGRAAITASGVVTLILLIGIIAIDRRLAQRTRTITGELTALERRIVALEIALGNSSEATDDKLAAVASALSRLQDQVATTSTQTTDDKLAAVSSALSRLQDQVATTSSQATDDKFAAVASTLSRLQDEITAMSRRQSRQLHPVRGRRANVHRR